MKRNFGISLDSGSQKIFKTNISTTGKSGDGGDAVGDSKSNLTSPVLMDNNVQVVEQWAQSKSKLNKINFTWIIHNFSFRQEKIGDWIESPTFSFDVDDEIKWCLRLYPKGRYEQNKDYLFIFLRLASLPCNQSKILGKFKFSILNPDPHKTLKSKYSDVLEYEFNRFWGFPLLVKRDFLLNNGFLPGDKLTTLCVVSYVSENANISSQKNIDKIKIPESKITDDLRNLLYNQKYSDATLIVGKYEFPVHKAILAARSDVFAAMFEHKLNESQSGRITITDVSREVVQEMLNFIYTEEVPKLNEMANHLLAAADKYALTKLKAMAEELMFSKLSIKTVVETLVLAHVHNAKQLKEQTFNFIVAHARDIIKTKEWHDLINTNAHASLIIETLDVLFTQLK